MDPVVLILKNDSMRLSKLFGVRIILAEIGEKLEWPLPRTATQLGKTGGSVEDCFELADGSFCCESVKGSHASLLNRADQVRMTPIHVIN